MLLLALLDLCFCHVNMLEEESPCGAEGPYPRGSYPRPASSQLFCRPLRATELHPVHLAES